MFSLSENHDPVYCIHFCGINHSAVIFVTAIVIVPDDARLQFSDSASI